MTSPLKADLRNSSLVERSEDILFTDLDVEGWTFYDQLTAGDKVSISTLIICPKFRQLMNYLF